MPLIVDTYNVLHAVGVLPPDLAGIGVGGLMDLVERSRFGADSGILVCDGTPRPGIPPRRGRLRVRYAGPGREADDVIESMIARSTSPRRLLVVSSDGRVVRAARRRRCRTMSAAAFLGRLARDAAADRRPAPPARPTGGLRAGEIDRWIDAFGLTADDLDAIDELASTPPASPPRPDADDGSGSIEEPPMPRHREPRALEDVERLDDIDPRELERFDMDEWV